MCSCSEGIFLKSKSHLPAPLFWDLEVAFAGSEQRRQIQHTPGSGPYQTLWHNLTLSRRRHVSCLYVSGSDPLSVLLPQPHPLLSPLVVSSTLGRDTLSWTQLPRYYGQRGHLPIFPIKGKFSLFIFIKALPLCKLHRKFHLLEQPPQISFESVVFIAVVSLLPPSSWMLRLCSA